MDYTFDRVTHTVICIAAFIGYYSILMLFSLMPGYVALAQSSLAMPVLYFLFLAPFTVIIWRHYQKSVSLLALGKVTLSGTGLPLLAIITLYVINSWFGQEEHWSASLIQLSGFPLVLFLVCVCLLAPVLEEVIFRGFLLNAGMGWGKWGQHLAITGLSLVFASIHSQYESATTFVVLFVFSAILCHTRLRTGGLFAPMALHSLNNTIAMLWVFG